MHKLIQRLLLFQLLGATTWQEVDGVNFTRLIELSQHIRLREDIRSLVVFSQRSFVQNLSGFEMFLRHQGSKVPMVLVDNVYTETEPLSPILGLWSFAFVFMDEIQNLNMLEVVNKTLLNVHSSKIIFILEKASKDNQSLVEFFKTCLHLGIVNVIVIFHNQVFSYQPFPAVTLENITVALIEDYFPDHLYNLQGYTFYSPIQQDGSRVFIYNDKDGNTKVTGVNTEIFRSFVQRHNATFHKLDNVNNQSSFDISDGLALLGQGKIDILLHTYSYFNAKVFAFSYPIGQVQWQTVVPYVGEISSYMYLILPFDSKVWICLAGSFIYISIAGYITLRYCQRLTEYGPVFSRSLTQFLNMPSIVTPCTLRAVLFEMQIFCYGLILTNFYLAFLSAFLTTTVQGNQIDSLEELFESGIKILTTSFESILISHTDVFEPRYNDIFRIEDMDLVNEYRKSLNRTYAFVMADDRTNFFLSQQKYLKKKRMHVARSTLGSYFLTFTMRRDSPFRKNFDAILLQLYQTGLYTKWEKDVYDLAVTTKYLQIFRSDSDENFRPLTMLHLFVCWITFAVGIGLACGVFLGEVLRFKVASKNVKNA